LSDRELQLRAAAVGENWRHTPYFERAEPDIDRQWRRLIFPLIDDCDFTAVVDLAAGHGRNTEKLRHLAAKVYALDVIEDHVSFCRLRFADDPRVECRLCDGITLTGISDASISLVYSFDSMVHFDPDVVRSYLRDIYRALLPGGRAMCHHSNYTENPTGDFRESPHWRNFMSRELFAHYAHKEGLEVVRAQLVDWGIPELDCITVLERAPR
jgi:SAM-dependent methyltransferase